MKPSTASLEERFLAWSRSVAANTEKHASGGARIDLHAHLGIDSGSGLEMTAEALEAQLAMAGVERALLIPLSASDGYHRTNLRLIERAAASGGRHRALYRIDPRAEQMAARVREGFDAGAVGLKLHPVSDGCEPLDPRLAGALEAAQEARAMVLVHTGVDVARAALDTLEAARRYPGARFVLGHVPAEALQTVSAAAAQLGNVWTCLSWWGPLDVAYALQANRHDRVVFGSDPPYGNVVTGLAQTVLVARALGWSDERIDAVVGGNAAVLMDGLEAPDAALGVENPDDHVDLLAESAMEFQRCYLALLSAVASGWSGGKPASYFEFARHALEPDQIDDDLRDTAAQLRESIELAESLHEAGMSEQAYAAGTVALTQALCATRLSRMGSSR